MKGRRKPNVPAGGWTWPSPVLFHSLNRLPGKPAIINPGAGCFVPGLSMIYYQFAGGCVIGRLDSDKIDSAVQMGHINGGKG